MYNIISLSEYLVYYDIFRSREITRQFNFLIAVLIVKYINCTVQSPRKDSGYTLYKWKYIVSRRWWYNKYSSAGISIFINYASPYTPRCLTFNVYEYHESGCHFTGRMLLGRCLSAPRSMRATNSTSKSALDAPRQDAMRRDATRERDDATFVSHFFFGEKTTTDRSESDSELGRGKTSNRRYETKTRSESSLDLPRESRIVLLSHTREENREIAVTRAYKSIRFNFWYIENQNVSL